MTKLPLRVDVDFSLEVASEAMNGRIGGGNLAAIHGVALDTRALRKGDLFFALRAARDGHDFVDEAVSKGAAAVVVDHELNCDVPRVLVSDTTEALGRLARHRRRSWGKRVIGITGSNGKSTTKEMTAAILGTTRRVLKSPGTWNNALGVPLSLLCLRPEHDVVVLEMGISNFGEMRQMASVAEPDVAVITNIGPTHLEKLKTLDGVAEAKGELFESLRPDGVAVVNLDDHRVAALGQKVKCRKMTVSMSGPADIEARMTEDRGERGVSVTILSGGREIALRSSFAGAHNISNLLCAMGAAHSLNTPPETWQQGIDSVEKMEMRLELLRAGRGIRIVNDCYNANPGSTLAALRVCTNMEGGRKIAVLGDMMELGEYSARAHRDTGIHVAQLRFHHLFAVGRYAGDLAQGAIQGGMAESAVTPAETKAEVVGKIAASALPQDVILVKGSRGMKMEELTEQLIRLLGTETT